MGQIICPMGQVIRPMGRVARPAGPMGDLRICVAEMSCGLAWAPEINDTPADVGPEDLDQKIAVSAAAA
jgi:hypothetical protein